MKRATQNNISKWIFFVIFAVYAVTLIFPFYWCVLNSFKTRSEFLGGNLWGLPEVWYFKNWAESFTLSTSSGITIPKMYLNSIILTLGCTVFSVASSSAAAYVLAKYKFPGKSFMYTFALVVMMIPTTGSMAALYKLYSNIRLINTYTGIFITSLGGFGTAFIMLYGFFRNLSWDYAEAARIDGAGHFRIYFIIMLPMAIPAISAVAILQGLGYWNDYFTVYMYAPEKSTIAVGLQDLQNNMRGNFPLLFAAMMFSVLPIILIFVAAQKVIMNNTSMGGLKG